jgi:hypothetical protein
MTDYPQQTEFPQADSPPPPAKTVTIQDVSIGLLDVDLRVQREWDASRSNTIAKNWNVTALGILTLSDRRDGTGNLYVVDGQHRWRAAQKLYPDGTYELPAKILTGLTLPEEAELFKLLNTQKPTDPISLFRVALIEGNRMCVEIDEVITAAGWRIGSGPSQKGYFAAVKAAQSAYKRAEQVHGQGWGKDAVRRAIDIVSKAWQFDTPKSTDARIFSALVLMIVHNWEDMNDTIMAQRLAETPPVAVLGHARGLQSVGMRIDTAIVDYLARLYNRGLPARDKVSPAVRARRADATFA